MSYIIQYIPQGSGQNESMIYENFIAEQMSWQRCGLTSALLLVVQASQPAATSQEGSTKALGVEVSR